MKKVLLSGLSTHGYKSLDEVNVLTSFYRYISLVKQGGPVVGVVAFGQEACFHRTISSTG